MKNWQKHTKRPFYMQYKDPLVGTTSKLLTSLRFFKVACGVKGSYGLKVV